MHLLMQGSVALNYSNETSGIENTRGYVLLKGWLKSKALTDIPQAGMVLGWVTFLALDLQPTLPHWSTHQSGGI